MPVNKQVPIVYFYLYGLFKREIGGGNMIHISQIHPIMKWVIRVPKKYHPEIIDEMICFSLLKKRDRDNYELLTIRKKCLNDSLGQPLWSFLI